MMDKNIIVFLIFLINSLFTGQCFGGDGQQQRPKKGITTRASSSSSEGSSSSIWSSFPTNAATPPQPQQPQPQTVQQPVAAATTPFYYSQQLLPYAQPYLLQQPQPQGVQQPTQRQPWLHQQTFHQPYFNQFQAQLHSPQAQPIAHLPYPNSLMDINNSRILISKYGQHPPPHAAAGTNQLAAISADKRLIANQQQRDLPMPSNLSMGRQNAPSVLNLSKLHINDPKLKGLNEMANKMKLPNEKPTNLAQNNDGKLARKHSNSEPHTLKLISLVPTQKEGEELPVNLVENKDKIGNSSMPLAMPTLECGSSAKSPICIGEDEEEAEENHREKKRPIGRDLLEENAQIKGKQKKLESDQREGKAEEENDLSPEKQQFIQIKQNFLNTILQFVVMILHNILGLEIESIDQMIANFKQGLISDKSAELKLALSKMDVNKVMENILDKLLHNEQLQIANKFFFHKYLQINREAKFVFGQEIFKITEVEAKYKQIIDLQGEAEVKHKKTFKFEWISLKSENIQNKKVKILFFLVKLIRNLAGQLETPYPSDILQDTTNTQLTLRKCIIAWITPILNQMSKEFYTTISGLNNGKHMANKMKELDDFDYAIEVLHLAHFSIQYAFIAAIIGDQMFKIIISSAEVFLEWLSKISRNNILCPMVIAEQQQKKLNFEILIGRSALVKLNYGISSTFIALMNEATKDQRQNIQFMNIFQSAFVYLKLFKSLLELFEKKPKLEEQLKKYETKANEWKITTEFLRESTAQIENFFKQWKLAKEEHQKMLAMEKEKSQNELWEFPKTAEEGGEEMEDEKMKQYFLSDYLMDNCILFMANIAEKKIIRKQQQQQNN